VPWELLLLPHHRHCPLFTVLLALPNPSSTRQWKLHHHRRQVMEHSHSPIYHLWRHGMSCDTKAHRTRRGEGSEVGATHATPRPVRRALGSWSLPARSGALSMLLLHPKCSLTGLIFCAVAAYLFPCFLVRSKASVRGNDHRPLSDKATDTVLEARKTSSCGQACAFLPKMQVHSEHVGKREPTVCTSTAPASCPETHSAG
jgi:hypothetical protein